MSLSPGSAHPYKRGLCNQPQTKPKLGSLIKVTIKQACLNEEIATANNAIS